MCFVVTTELIIARGNPLYTQIHFMLRSLLSIRLLSRNFQIDLFSLAMQIFVVVYDFPLQQIHSSFRVAKIKYFCRTIMIQYSQGIVNRTADHL